MFRSTFSEWYSPDEQTIADIISNGTIALDTNVLLSLYRISAVARQDLLRLLGDDRIRPRLFIPYQVGLEYHRRRVSVAIDQNVGYKNLQARIEKVRSALSELTVKDADNDIRDNQVRDELNAATETAAKTTNLALDKLASKVKEIQNTHVIADKQLAAADPVRDALEELFADTGQVGTKLADDELEARKKEATKRYETETPPGYEDVSEKDDPSGDYLIWRELLERAAAKPGPILFVTNDKKPDWYAKDKNKRILGPRVELRAEMAAVTTHPYHQTPLNSFLHLVEKHLDLALSKETVEQVKEASNRRTFLAWNPTDSPLSNSTWTVPTTRETLARAQRIIEGTTLRNSGDRAELLAAIDRLVADGTLDHNAESVLMALRDNIETDARHRIQLTNEMKSTRDRETYDAVRDSETESNQDSEG